MRESERKYDRSRRRLKKCAKILRSSMGCSGDIDEGLCSTSVQSASSNKKVRP